MNSPEAKCPHCHEGHLHTWNELTEDQREIVRRLPASADFSAAEREAMHRWCTRCWYETQSKALDA